MEFVSERRLSSAGVAVTMTILLLVLLAGLFAGPVPSTVSVVVVVLCTVVFVVAPQSTLYVVGEERISVRWLLGWLQFPREELVSVRIQPFRLTLRSAGIGTPNLAQGWFEEENLGRVQVYGGKGAGVAALLLLRDGRKVLLTPKDLGGFLNYLRERGYPVI